MTSRGITPQSFWELLKGSFEGHKGLWILFVSMLMASVLTVSGGAAEVYKAESMLPILKHIAYLLIAFASCWIVSQLPSSFYRGKGLWFYSGFVVILMVWLVVHPKVINDAARWVDLGIVTVQPSDFFKIALILWGALVGTLSYETEKKKWSYFNSYWVISLVLIAIILFKNASTGILLIAFLVCYSLMAKMPFRLWRKWVTGGMLAGMILVGTIAVLPNETLKQLPLINRGTVWKSRVSGMFRGETEESKYSLSEDETRQERLGQVALARGSFGGVGMGQSKTRDFLAMAYSDYALAILVEEWGLGAYLIIVCFYVFWFVIAGRMAHKERNRYRKLLILGIGLFFPMQALINIAVISGLFVTGQTLPLISWGGTSLLVTSMAMGMLISISRTQIEIERLERSEKRSC